MKLLAIETATSQGSVAVIDGDKITAETLPNERDHGRTLARVIDRLIGDVQSLDGYAIAIGPGSFTGLRVGLALLKGIALVHPKPVVPISTLSLVIGRAKRAGAKDPIVAILDARAGEVFAQSSFLPEGLYRAEAVEAACAGVTGTVAGDRVSGLLDGWSHWSPLGADPPLASLLAEMGAARLGVDGVDVQPLEPAYLQPVAADRNRPSDTRPTRSR